MALVTLGAALCALSIWSSRVRWETFNLSSPTDYFGYSQSAAARDDIGQQLLLFLSSLAPQLTALGIATIIGSLFLLSRPNRPA